MTQRHAMRRGVAPRPSDKDMRIWARLLKRAAPIGRAPHSDGLSFVLAAEKAGKAIMPRGHQHTASPFTALVRTGKGWLTLNAAEREAAGERVRGLIAECEAALEALADGRRERKDIDG